MAIISPPACLPDSRQAAKRSSPRIQSRIMAAYRSPTLNCLARQRIQLVKRPTHQRLQIQRIHRPPLPAQATRRTTQTAPLTLPKRLCAPIGLKHLTSTLGLTMSSQEHHRREETSRRSRMALENASRRGIRHKRSRLEKMGLALLQRSDSRLAVPTHTRSFECLDLNRSTKSLPFFILQLNGNRRQATDRRASMRAQIQLQYLLSLCLYRSCSKSPEPPTSSNSCFSHINSLQSQPQPL